MYFGCGDVVINYGFSYRWWDIEQHLSYSHSCHKGLKRAERLVITKKQSNVDINFVDCHAHATFAHKASPTGAWSIEQHRFCLSLYTHRGSQSLQTCSHFCSCQLCVMEMRCIGWGVRVRGELGWRSMAASAGALLDAETFSGLHFQFFHSPSLG